MLDMFDAASMLQHPMWFCHIGSTSSYFGSEEHMEWYEGRK